MAAKLKKGDRVVVLSGRDKGKGSPEYWACKVKPGRIMFEIDGVPEAVAREALRLAAMKMSVKSRIVVREDW